MFINIRYNRFVSKENAIYEQLSKEEDERYNKLVSEENAILKNVMIIIKKYSINIISF